MAPVNGHPTGSGARLVACGSSSKCLTCKWQHYRDIRGFQGGCTQEAKTATPHPALTDAPASA